VVKRDKNISTLENIPNICFHYIPANRKILFALYSMFTIIKVTLKFGIEIFHSHGVDEGALNNVLKSVFRRRQLISLRTNWWIWLKVRKESEGYLNRLIYGFYLIISSLLIRRADALMVTNTQLKRIVSRISEGTPVLIKQNTVDPVLFNPTQITTNLKKDFVDSKPIVMYIGRLLPHKGVEYLIEATSSAKRIHPDIVLILIGDGSHKLLLEKLVKQKNLRKDVLFMGYQKNIAEWLSIADIFVLPSLTEGSSNVLLEAMSMSRPVIATRVGNAPDIIIHLENGILVEPKNIKQIAEYISILLENNALANKIGKNARATIIKNFSHFSVNDIVALYNKLLSPCRINK
jgi:glycosyltransferase involved in cell wall biosynthesis